MRAKGGKAARSLPKNAVEVATFVMHAFKDQMVIKDRDAGLIGALSSTPLEELAFPEIAPDQVPSPECVRKWAIGAADPSKPDLEYDLEEAATHSPLVTETGEFDENGDLKKLTEEESWEEFTAMMEALPDDPALRPASPPPSRYGFGDSRVIGVDHQRVRPELWESMVERSGGEPSGGDGGGGDGGGGDGGGGDGGGGAPMTFGGTGDAIPTHVSADDVFERIKAGMPPIHAEVYSPPSPPSPPESPSPPLDVAKLFADLPDLGSVVESANQKRKDKFGPPEARQGRLDAVPGFEDKYIPPPPRPPPSPPEMPPPPPPPPGEQQQKWKTKMDEWLQMHPLGALPPFPPPPPRSEFEGSTPIVETQQSRPNQQRTNEPRPNQPQQRPHGQPQQRQRGGARQEPRCELPTTAPPPRHSSGGAGGSELVHVRVCFAPRDHGAVYATLGHLRPYSPDQGGGASLQGARGATPPGVRPSTIQPPGLTTPGIHVPSVHTPGINTPAPRVETPRMASPRVNTPGMDMPGIGMPGSSAPKLKYGRGGGDGGAEAGGGAAGGGAASGGAASGGGASGGGAERSAAEERAAEARAAELRKRLEGDIDFDLEIGGAQAGASAEWPPPLNAIQGTAGATDPNSGLARAQSWSGAQSVAPRQLPGGGLEAIFWAKRAQVGALQQALGQNTGGRVSLSILERRRLAEARRLTEGRRLGGGAGQSLELTGWEAEGLSASGSSSGSCELFDDSGRGWDEWAAEWQRMLDAWWLSLPMATAGSLQSCAAFLGGVLTARFEMWRLLKRMGGAVLASPPPSLHFAEASCEELVHKMERSLPDFPEPPQMLKWWMLPIPRLIPSGLHAGRRPDWGGGGASSRRLTMAIAPPSQRRTP